MEYFVAVVRDILGILYRTCGASMLMAVLAMGVYRQVKKSGLNEVIREWAEDFRENVSFRKQFLLVFYVCIMLFCTVLGKSILGNPLDNVLGVWGLRDGDGAVYIANLEHLILFFPFILLLFQVREEKEKIRGNSVGVALGKSVKISFFAALAIELCQMFLKIGAFRLSDLFFCTLGGALGGIVYWCWGRSLARIVDGVKNFGGWMKKAGGKLVSLVKGAVGLVKKLINFVKKLGGWDTKPWKGITENIVETSAETAVETTVETVAETAAMAVVEPSAPEEKQPEEKVSAEVVVEEISPQPEMPAPGEKPEEEMKTPA